MRKHHCENTERPKPPVKVAALLLSDNQGKVGLCSPSVQPGRSHRRRHRRAHGQLHSEINQGYQRAHTPFRTCTDDRAPLKADMASHSVYTEDFKAWDNPVRVHPFRPCDNLKVNGGQFSNATTSRDSFCRRRPPVAVRESSRPAPPARVPPFNDTTNYRSHYLSHPVQPRRPPAWTPYQPPGPPLTRVYTSHTDFRGQPTQTARSFKPAAVRERNPAAFQGTTEFRDRFQTWPLPPQIQPRTREYRAPAGDMALLSTTGADFGEHGGFQVEGPARETCVRNQESPEASLRSSVRSTMKEDFRAWVTVRRHTAAPPPQELEWPRGPFARTTTARASYTPKAAQHSLSCKPRPGPLNTGPPMEKISVYRSSFTAPMAP